MDKNTNTKFYKNTTTEPKKRGLHFDKSRLVSETSNKEILLEYICSEFQSRLLSSQGLANFSTDSETYVILVSCRQQNIKISEFLLVGNVKPQSIRGCRGKDRNMINIRFVHLYADPANVPSCY